MINSIDPNEFVTMIPDAMMDELRSHRIYEDTIKMVCQYLNDIRAGVVRRVELQPHELRKIIVTKDRITFADGTSRLMRHGERLNDITQDYVLDMTGNGVNFIERRGNTVVWNLQKDEGKRYPKGYKLFMSRYFSHYHNCSINKIDMFYDEYVRTYNELYQKALDEQVN